MENPSLENLIKEIKTDGIEALKNLITRKEVEQYFIDFKTTEFKDYTNKKALANNDRKNLAKAISGFGNSEGGLLIWGINTRGKGDFANYLKLITSPENFLALINSEISRLTTPQHPSIEGFVVKNKNDKNKGYVVVVIPKYEGLPIQVINGYQFFMRAGDSFVHISHGILTGMFGRRPNPNVTIMFTISDNEPVLEDNFIVFSVGIQLVNIGKGIAKDIFINCSVFGLGDPSKIGLQYRDHNFNGYDIFGTGFNFMSKQGFKMAPEQRIQPLIYSFKLKPQFKQDLTLQFTVGAEGQIPNKKEITINKEELTEMYNLFTKNNNFKFIEKLLGKDE